MLVQHHVDLTISLNAATPETYKRVSGQTRYELAEVIDNLKRLSDAGRKAGFRFTICMVIMNENVAELPEYVRLARDVGAHTAYFGEQNYDGAGDRLGDLLLRDPERVRQKLAEARDLGAELGVRVGHSKRDPSIWGVEETFVPCKYLWKMPYITWDGFLVPCCARPFPGVFHFGNVLEPGQHEGTPFRELWFSEPYQALRREVARGQEGGLCDGCQHLRPGVHASLACAQSASEPRHG